MDLGRTYFVDFDVSDGEGCTCRVFNNVLTIILLNGITIIVACVILQLLQGLLVGPASQLRLLRGLSIFGSSPLIYVHSQQLIDLLVAHGLRVLVALAVFGVDAVEALHFRVHVCRVGLAFAVEFGVLGATALAPVIEGAGVARNLLDIVKIIIVPAHTHRPPHASSSIPLLVPLPLRTSLHATRVALPDEGARLREAVALRVVALLFADDDLFGLPVAFVAAAEAGEVVEAAAVEGVAELAEGLFQIFIRGLIATE